MLNNKMPFKTKDSARKDQRHAPAQHTTAPCREPFGQCRNRHCGIARTLGAMFFGARQERAQVLGKAYAKR